MDKLLVKKVIMSVFAGAMLFGHSSVCAADIILKPAGSDVDKFEGSYEELKTCADWSYKIWDDIYVVYYKDGCTNNELTFGAGLQGTVLKAEIYGGNTSVGDVEGNKVTINGGAFEYSLYGGATYEGNVKNNAVNVNNGSLDTICGGGSYDGEAKNNVVNINGGYIEYACGGYGLGTGSASNNVVNITGGTVETIEGGESEKEASHNIVNMTGGTVESIIGGFSLDLASHNSVNISSGLATGYISGGRGKVNSTNNSVNISGDAVIESNSDIHGGYAYEGDSYQNKINISGGTFASNDETVNIFLEGGYAYKGNAYENVVSINGGNFKLDIEGACAWYGNVYDNTVNINGGTFDGEFCGGYSGHGNAYGNIVNINGGTFIGNIYGGYAYEGNAYGNIVNISGNANLMGASLYGSNVADSLGNVLNIGEGWNGSVKTIKNFNEINVGKDATITFTKFANECVGNQYAINGSVNVDTGAKVNLQIGSIELKEAIYNIATQYTGALEAWTLDNYLMEAEKWTNDNGLQVAVRVKDAGKIAEDIGLSQKTARMIADVITKNQSENLSSADVAAGKFVENVMNKSTSKEVMQEAINAAEKMAEAGGNSATAANIVNNVTSATNQRLSLGGNAQGGSKGGHGVGLLEEDGSAVWAQYVHGKDTVKDMPSTAGTTSYTGQFNGIVMGTDFKKVGKFQSGIAFNYGEGDTNSFGSSASTRSEYDFWGIGYYGNVRNENINFIFDINYGQTESDITQKSSGGLSEVDSKTKTWAAGVRLEKLYSNDAVQIVPYAGLRYMTIDTDDYANVTMGARYKVDRQNIWLLPLGVSIKEEIVNDNGWVVTPKVDLSYIWAFGDTESSMDVVFGSTDGSKVGYTVMDDGSFLGLVGVEATMEDWTFGVSYSYQKGDHSESKKWFVDAKYSF
ncbi:MAG: autotransporter outer membrane beta-barrel domain-containing protein [Lachnospiraceae bacterium]|nr:autotransporter outer membrane beta-barrel domain-containing protein [Lachnospiraceae bacterium]